MPFPLHRPSSRPASWQPGLAANLAVSFERSHAARLATGYSTASWLGLATSDGPATVPILQHSAQFELLTGPARQRYEGLALVLAETLPGEVEAALFREAVQLLRHGDQLRDAVRVLVRSVHALVPCGEGFDTSHSDPDVPFSVFLSIPTGEKHAALRLAESILHEAMHLQLSLFEAGEPLVGESDASGYSPWQGTVRPIGGLVHGLFVFRAIFDWLGTLDSACSDGASTLAYVENRRHEILQEMSCIADLAASPALTPTGARLVTTWLDFS